MKILTSFIIAVVLFVTSEALLVYYGFVKIYFIIFIPVFVSSSFLSLLPLLFFLVPFALSLISSRKEFGYAGIEGNSQQPSETRKGGRSVIGGVVMIGPIPIIFGKNINWKILITLVAIALIFIVAWFVLSK